MKQFILSINGSICSGKSSVAELLLNKRPRSFRVSTDKIKWLISNFSKDEQRELARRLTLKLAEAACDEGLSLIIDGNGRFDKNYNQDYEKLAEKKKIFFIEINIDAPLEVLKERFNKRVESAMAANSKISCTTEEKMLEFYNSYLKYKNQEAVAYDSSLLSSEEICEEVLELLKK